MSEATELQRAVERLTGSIQSLEQKVVLQVQYLADKEAAAERWSNLNRRVDELATGTGGRIDGLSSSLNSKIDAAERAARDDHDRLEKKVDADIADRKADRRLIIAAFLALVAQIILQIYQQAQPGAPS